MSVRPGKALDTLPVLAEEKLGPFDLTFIDADMLNNPGYFEWAPKLSHRGGVIVVDNVVRNGAPRIRTPQTPARSACDA